MTIGLKTDHFSSGVIEPRCANHVYRKKNNLKNIYNVYFLIKRQNFHNCFHKIATDHFSSGVIEPPFFFRPRLARPKPILGDDRSEN